MGFPGSCRMSAGLNRIAPQLAAIQFLVMLFVALPVDAEAQSPGVQGWLSVVWTEDPRPGKELRGFLRGDDGITREVVLDQATLEQVGGARLLGGVRVDVILQPEVTPQPGEIGKRFQVRSVRLLEGVARPKKASALQASSRPYAWILCRYADNPVTPITPAEAAYMSGTSYPGAGHYFNELSEGAANLDGTAVFGWYALPSPRSAYVQGANINIGRLTTDCASAADAEVHFPSYSGVTIQVNGDLSTRATPPYDVLSFGGSYTLDLDGVVRTYPMLWLSGQHAFNYVIVHHEIGHSFGWPHSSGPYNETYDSWWDIMSRGYVYQDPAYGTLGPHTIAYHKAKVGWIPEERIWRPGTHLPTSILLVRSALPPAGSGYQAAIVPDVTDPNQFITVEARRNGVGYDQGMPGDGVIIHRVNLLRADRTAQVVDPDGNGNPNDSGAIWLPGETFTSMANGILVRVDAVAPTGYWVTITENWFAVAPTSRRDTVVVGSEAPLPDSATVTFPPGAITTDWSVRHLPSATWVTLLTESGSGSDLVRWEFHPAGLPVGTYVDTIRVESPGALGEPGFVVAVLEVRPPPTMMASRATAHDSVAQGAVSESCDSILVRIIGFGASATTWRASHGGSGWLRLSDSVGQGTGRVRWRRDPAGLEPGIFVDTITIAAIPVVPGSPAVVVDSLIVFEPAVAAACAVAEFLGISCLSGDERGFLDVTGNADGSYNVGDLLAFLDRKGLPLTAALLNALASRKEGVTP